MKIGCRPRRPIFYAPTVPTTVPTFRDAGDRCDVERFCLVGEPVENHAPTSRVDMSLLRAHWSTNASLAGWTSTVRLGWFLRATPVRASVATLATHGS